MHRNRRLEWLRQELRREGSLVASQAAGRLGVTAMTLWRDLKWLEQRGELRRVHGGAVTVLPPGDAEPDFTAKAAHFSEDRLAIVRYAARRFLKPGMTVAVEGGTTAVSLLPYFDIPDLTILTNSVEAMRHTRPSHTVFSSGGIYRHPSRTLVGPPAVSFFEGRKSEVCFLSASGFTARDGLTDPNPLEIAVKRAMCAQAAHVILLLDASKFGRRSLRRLCPLETVDTLITNEGVPAPELRPFGGAGVTVELV